MFHSTKGFEMFSTLAKIVNKIIHRCFSNLLKQSFILTVLSWVVYSIHVELSMCTVCSKENQLPSLYLSFIERNRPASTARDAATTSKVAAAKSLIYLEHQRQGRNSHPTQLSFSPTKFIRSRLTFPRKCLGRRESKKTSSLSER